MKKNVLFWLLCMLFTTSQLLAQDRTISGVVTDAEDGESLIGVSVLVKGTTNGAVTDIDGRYVISNVSSDATTLIFSYVGYTTEEVAITGSEINLQMKSGVELEEVIVMGYSTVKKSDVTAAVSEVKGERLQNIPIGGIDNLLQGKSSGLQVTSMNGRPGGNAYIRIRGTGSLNASSEPLILLDGVEISSRDYAMINPADVEDVTVLKDAAAATIYGSRASNGVILVTTKRGSKAGKAFSIQYNYNRGVKSKVKDNFKLMNAAQKIFYEWELGKGNPWILEMEEDADDFIARNETDWFDVLLRKATVETHDVSVSGSKEDFNYYLSFGSYKEDGMAVNSYFERMNIRFNSDYRANKWLKVGNSFTLVTAKDASLRDRYNQQNPFMAIYSMNPYETVYEQDEEGNVIYDENGNPLWNFNTTAVAQLNPLEQIVNNPEVSNYTDIIGSAYVQADLIEGLSLKTEVGGKIRNEAYLSKTYPGAFLDLLSERNGTVNKGSYENTMFTWSNVAVYNKTIKDNHNLSLLAGTELLRTTGQSLLVSAYGYPNRDLMQISLAANVLDARGTQSHYGLFSIFGEAKYNFQNKYYVGTSVRRDGSANFGPKNRYGTFWGATAGWNIANESFLSDVRQISQLKLRGSVGTSGNDRIGSFLYLSTYNVGTYGNNSASFPATPANPELKWESNLNWNIGLDFGFFQNRLTGSVEYYNKQTNDLLFPVALSYTSGFTSQTQNIGKMENKGVELELRADAVRKKNGSLSFFGNYSRNYNKVVSIPTDEEFLPTSGKGLGLTVLKEGKEAYTFYLTRWAGVDASNGEPLYYDKDGNVTNVYSDGDNVILDGKSVLPKWYGGFGLNAEYRGIFVDADFTYSGGNYTFNVLANDLLSDGENVTNIQRVDALDYWRNPGDIKSIPNPAAAGYTSRWSDKWLQKGDYFRLRSLRVGYSLPHSILSKAKISNLSVYFQGTNLFTVTKYEGDPEVGMSSEESVTESIGIPGEASMYSYPQFRGFSFGVNVGF